MAANIPLTTYRDEYDFLADFDLFQPFTNEMAPFSPVSEVDKRVDVTVGSSPFA